MAFVNEFISKEDLKNFGLEEIDRRYIVGGKRSRTWTVDRERNIYLRCVAEGREEIAHRSTWTLYWNQTLIEVEIETVHTGRLSPGVMAIHQRVRYIRIPERLRNRRDEVIDVLKEALTAYKDGGVFSVMDSVQLTLDA